MATVKEWVGWESYNKELIKTSLGMLILAQNTENIALILKPNRVYLGEW